MKPGMDNLKVIAEMAPPMTYTRVRCFTGMMGFFWHFIKAYAKIAKPLNDLLEALGVFEELKMRCMMVPILAFADFKKLFWLETDALKEGLGAVLLQESGGRQFHPVAFTS